MPSEKVIYLKFANHGSSVPGDSFQMDLFDFQTRDTPRIILLDPDTTNQNELFTIIARNRFEAVLDLRLKPVFRKPSYSHKEITSHLYRNNIRYEEIALLVQKSNGRLSAMQKFLSECFGSLGQASAHYTLCLADREANEAGIVMQFRSILQRLNMAVVEMHPRSILS